MATPHVAALKDFKGSPETGSKSTKKVGEGETQWTLVLYRLRGRDSSTRWLKTLQSGMTGQSML